MTSKAEELLCCSLRKILAVLPIGAPVDDSPGRFCALGGLEFYLPALLSEVYPNWTREGLDGIRPDFMRKTGEDEVEIFGRCILITDQTWGPIHVRLQIATSVDEVIWLEGRLGDGVWHPYNSSARDMDLPQTPDEIDWQYKITYGEKRT